MFDQIKRWAVCVDSTGARRAGEAAGGGGVGRQARPPAAGLLLLLLLLGAQLSEWRLSSTSPAPTPSSHPIRSFKLFLSFDWTSCRTSRHLLIFCECRREKKPSDCTDPDNLTFYTVRSDHNYRLNKLVCGNNRKMISRAYHLHPIQSGGINTPISI